MDMIDTSLLPDRMQSAAALRMLRAIAMQESRFKHRFQINGPARGYWQFEKIGVIGVITHPATKAHAEAVCAALNYPVNVDVLYEAIAHNDVLAACFARLLLWQHPDPLPDDTEAAWQYYLRQWRPGKPHRETWDEFFEE